MASRGAQAIAVSIFVTCLIFLSIYLHSNLPAPVLRPLPAAQRTKTCTSRTAVIRKDWNVLSDRERQAYVDSVRCLQHIPSRFGPGEVPASLSLWDDFVAVHINHTPATHKTAIFFAWHRHFEHLFEDALHRYCAFPPRQGIPYWNWASGRDNNSLDSVFTPAFLGGDGDGDEDTTLIGTASPARCVTTGPFANSTIRLGPIGPGDELFTDNLAHWKICAGSNAGPHCLSRKLNRAAAAEHLTPELTAAALGADTVDGLQQVVAGPNTAPALHGWAHAVVGGQVADAFVAPADPAFYLLHSMIDRLWTLWQAADPPKRRFAYCCEDEKHLFLHGGKAAGADKLLEFGVLGRDVQLWEVADPEDGPYCYRYDV